MDTGEVDEARARELCSAPVQGRRAATCSDRCRAERWRRDQDRSSGAETPGSRAFCARLSGWSRSRRDEGLVLMTPPDRALTTPLAAVRRR